MRILITTDWYKPVVNGVVTSVVNLANGLEAAGNEVRILTLSGSLRSYCSENVTYIGSISVGAVYPCARMKMALSDRLVRELAAWKPDIVHSQCEFSTFFLAKRIAQECGAPLVHTYHTVYEDFTHYFSPSVRFGRLMAAAFSKKILASVQAVIVPTQKIETMLKGYGISQPIAVIPSGLALEQFQIRMSEAERNRARSRLGFDKNDQVLLFLGRLAQEKNLEELFALLAHQNRRVKLLLVGNGPYRERLLEAAHALHVDDRVVFAGMVRPEEVARYYALGNVFVSASQSETQGLTYMEAMAAGLPLLCRDDPCLAQVIQDGVNGCLYRNENEFREKLELLLGDEHLRCAMAAAAKGTVFRRFSAEGFAANVLAEYSRQIDLAEAVRATAA